MSRKNYFADAVQREQFDRMIKAGSSAKQIVAYFKNTYQVDLPAYVVYSEKCRIKNGDKGKHAAKLGKAKQPKRHYKKRGGAAADPIVPTGGGMASPGTDGIKDLVDQLHSELEAYSTRIIKSIRIELVKAIAAARKKRIDAGENIDPIKEEELMLEEREERE